MPKKTKLPDLPFLKAQKILAVDLETKDDGLANDLGPGGVRGMGHILGIAVATEDHEWYFPLRHVDSENYPIQGIKKWCKDNLCTKGQLKLGANILYDLEWMKAEGFPITGPFSDVQHAEPLIDENAFTYSLDSLSKKYLPKGKGKRKDTLEEQARAYLGDGVKFKDAREVLYLLPSHIVGPYAEGDVRATYDVFFKQLDTIAAEELTEVLNYESRLIPLLLEMRFRGVRISLPKLNSANKKVEQETANQWKMLNAIAGKNKVSSVFSAGELAKLWDASGLPYPRTKTGRPSFTKQYLATVDHPVAKAVMKIKKLEKVKGMFIDGSLKRFMVKDRLFASANQLRSDEYGTVSGRFSYSKPNLQQVPSGDDEFSGELIRSLFIPDVGERWAKVDWSQIEYRIMAHFAKKLGLPKVDKLIEAYKNDRSTDMHAWLAELIHRPRKFSKAINFGVAYCMGLNKLAASLGISKTEGELIMTEYRAEVPWMIMLQKAATSKASRTGYIRTILGRRRRFNLYEPKGMYGKDGRPKPLPKHEAIEEWGQNITRAACYKALNALIQGSAADLMKVAMVEAYEQGIFDVIGIPGIVVHDEMDISIPNTRAADAGYDALRHLMENCIPMEVPIVADATIGKDWWNQKPFVFKPNRPRKSAA